MVLTGRFHKGFLDMVERTRKTGSVPRRIRGTFLEPVLRHMAKGDRAEIGATFAFDCPVEQENTLRQLRSKRILNELESRFGVRPRPGTTPGWLERKVFEIMDKGYTMEEAVECLEGVENYRKSCAFGTPARKRKIQGDSLPVDVDSQRHRAQIGENFYQITPAACSILKKRCEERGAWISGKNLRRGRPDRIISRMPEQVRRHIERRKPYGYRWVDSPRS